VAFWKNSASMDITKDPGSYGSTNHISDSTMDVEKTGAKEGEQKGRQQWGNPIEFLLSCVAMSVGLGNIWRFPFVAYQNGGGAFLIPYITVLLLIGKPLYYMELCLGQFASYGSVKVWQLAPAFKGVGYGQMLATWSVVTYYVSLMALTVFYFLASFHSSLPWASCGNWSSPLCVDAHTNLSALNDSLLNSSMLKSPSDEYFNREVLKISEYGLDYGIDAPEWRLSLCLLFSWVVLFIVLVKGVASAGKAAYFTALFPYLVLFILLGRGLTLPGAYDGVMFFISPQWEKLYSIQVWYEAVSQSFFSLSVGFGSITMFSSYNNFRHNVYRDATIISITDTFTSLLAGCTIFSILGHLAHQLGVDVKDVIKEGGTSLAFISYPDVLANFQFIPQFFAVMFFLMLFTLGVGSASALTGCVITIICDQFPTWKKWLVTLVVCIVGFFLGLFYVTPQGQYILTLVDKYGGGFIIFILAALEVIAVQWVYGVGNFCQDIEFMLGRKTGWYWRVCWAFIIPVSLLVIFFYVVIANEPLTHGPYVFGAGAIGFGMMLVAVALGMVPLCFFLGIYKQKEPKYFIDKVKVLFKPTDKWHPSDPVLAAQYKAFKAGKQDASLEGIDNPAPVVD